jgi:two-component system, cell cycle sensor histidine kinase and response regulator CckA
MLNRRWIDSKMDEKMNDTIKILYIDDYELDRELVKDALEKEHGGFEVTEAGNKREFEVLLKTRRFDLVLSDFNIAGYEGLQVIDAVRAHDPRIPVIIVTGTGSEEIAAAALKQGAADYVIKRPRHILKLPQTIFAAIEKKVLRDRRQKDAADLRESEERYRNILENVLVGVFQVTLDGQFLFANQKMMEIFGYSSWEDLKAVGSIAELYKQPEERPIIVDEIMNKGFVIAEREFKRKDGQHIRCKLQTRKTTHKNGTIILEGLIEDITKIRKLQTQLQQAQRLEAIGTLAGGIAHDFNNILSSVIGFTQLSLDDVLIGTHLHDNLTETLAAANRARDLVKQIMAFSRKIEQEKKPVQIYPLVKETIRMLRSVIPTNIDIREHMSKEMITVNADPSQMNQVFVNLITNASHAVDENGIIEIGLEVVIFDETIKNQFPDLLPGRYARISVGDNGWGIARENLNRIFDPYFTTKDPEKGTGLGLSVVHGIVKSHGGHITVYSEVGMGTTFQVYLPLSGQSLSTESSQQAPQFPGGTERILLVDDEPSIVNMQKQTLERLGYTVAAVTSSRNALETFRLSPASFDLMITDMTMPDLTGDKLARALKEIRPDIPVILCTGFSEKINSENAQDLVVDGFLMKPVERVKMAKMIRSVLEKVKTSAKG